MNKIEFLALFLLVFYSNLSAQTITGKITDINNEALPGVNVYEKLHPSNGVISGFDGTYSININSSSDKLIFSFIGFEKQEIEIKDRRQINIILKEEFTGLNEVVVVGYGKQKKANLTGAVASVSSEELSDKATTNGLDALQGIVPNLNIGYTNGETGSIPSVNIRGFESLNGGDPLILIDGIPSDAFTLARMNPEDIDQISVLKDAASAAIYGARAAYGVLLISTKSGLKDQGKLSVNYSGSIMFSSPIQKPKISDTYTHVLTRNIAEINRGSAQFFTDEYVEKVRLYHDDPKNNPIDELCDNGDYYYYGTIDYIDKTLDDYSTKMRHNFNIKGGDEKINYYISAGHTKDEGFLKYNKEKLDVYSVKAKLSSQVKKYLKVGFNYDMIKEEKKEPYDYYPASTMDWIYGQRTYFPITHPHNENEFLNTPIGYLKRSPKVFKEELNTTLGFDAVLTPIKDLQITGRYTYKEYDVYAKGSKKKLRFADNFGYNYPVGYFWQGYADKSLAYNSTIQGKSNIVDIFADYNYTLKNHNFKGLIGFNQEDFYRNTFYAERNGLINDNMPSLNLTNGEDYVGQSAYDWATRGVFYRINYDYKGKYLFETNGRYDGSSRFPKDDRFGFFPSFSAGWRISEEKFMKKFDWLNNAKLRISYGILGNQQLSKNNVIVPYPYIPAMSAGNIGYMLGNDNPIGVYPPPLVSKNLTWETVNTVNYGIDLNLFKSRLNSSFDFYNRKTKDMLVSGAAAPGILGGPAPERNAADLKTNGWELSINWSDKIDKFKYQIGLILSNNETEITKYDNPNKSLSDYYVGHKIGDIWGYTSNSLIQDQSTVDEINNSGSHEYIYSGEWKLGDVLYEDINGDGKVNDGSYTLDDHGDLSIIGNTNPKYNYSINLGCEYKGFKLFALLQGVGKRDLVPNGYMFFPYAFIWRNIQEFQLDYWTPENTDAYFPQLEGEAARNYKTQTRYLQDGSYLRLKDVSLSYSLPQSLLQKTFIQKASLTLSGRNLYTWTDLVEIMDPESDQVNGLIYPFRKTYSIGINLEF